MERKDVALFTLAGLIILSAAALIVFEQTQEIERRVLEVRYEIGDRTGFNVESERLNFGRIIPGSIATRSISINNTYDFPIYVELTGDLLQPKLLIFNSSRIRVGPAEAIQIPVSLAPSSNLGVGNYSSFVVVHILK